MTLRDLRGVPVSTTDRRALDALERATELSACYLVDPLAEIDAALAEDPDFVMGHCLKAGLLITSTDEAARPALRQCVDTLDRLSPRANGRERAHAAAARAWSAGEFGRAIRLYGEILVEHPRDLVALQVAHVGDFLLGDSLMLRDRVAQVLPHWSDEVPGRGYVLGMHAFGLEETGLYARAEESARAALALNPRDGWAVHAATHVLEMQGSTREGIDWLDGRKGDWAPGSGFAYHLWWHLCLFHLELGDADRALAIYDQGIHPRPSRISYENVDAAALLWRLSLRGVDAGARWQALADDWTAMGGTGHYAFNDVHALLAQLGAGRLRDAEETLAGMERRLASGGSNATVTREVGLPLGRALMDFTRGRYRACTEGLLAVRSIAHRFGGSHAQRDVIHLTLVEAALRSGQGALARALVAERLDLKPASPLNRLLATRAREAEAGAV